MKRLGVMDAANQIGLAARGAIVDWDQLSQIKGTCVLWINGNHFVTAMPQSDLAELEDNEIFIRSDGTGHVWTKQELIGVWQGEALNNFT